MGKLRLGAETRDKSSCCQLTLPYRDQKQQGKPLKGECGRNLGQGEEEPLQQQAHPTWLSLFPLPQGTVMSVAHEML